MSRPTDYPPYDHPPTARTDRAELRVVCERAAVDGDCPFTHDWRPATPGGRDLPFMRSEHDGRPAAARR